MNWPLFLALTGFALMISWQAFRTQEAYGFFRFLGFESLALLLAWNAHRWYRDPWSLPQTISWVIMALATVLAAHGSILLRKVGQARQRLIEDTQQLVEKGAYRYIRHPLYASLILVSWASFLKGLDWESGLLALAASAALFATARWEERFNLERFGKAYADYMGRTKMFIPMVF